ncbi:MAG: ribonuclease H [Anaerolineales bacterium]
MARLARTGVAAPSRHAAPSSPPEATATALPEVTLYCRGACQGNPGPGGYAAVVAPAQGEPHVVSGGWPSATNNAMELWAVIAGLRSLEHVSRVHIYTTSRYVLDGATRWLAEWEQNGWHTRDGREVQNAALWQELAHVMGDHDLTWHHVPAAQPNRLLRLAARTAQDAASRQGKDSG